MQIHLDEKSLYALYPHDKVVIGVNIRRMMLVRSKMRIYERYNDYSPGTYHLDLHLRNRPVPGSPFAVSAYAPHNVVIEPAPGGAVGKPVQFTGK